MSLWASWSVCVCVCKNEIHDQQLTRKFSQVTSIIIKIIIIFFLYGCVLMAAGFYGL